MKVARIYLRVSTDEQDLERQEGSGRSVSSLMPRPSATTSPASTGRRLQARVSNRSRFCPPDRAVCFGHGFLSARRVRQRARNLSAAPPVRAWASGPSILPRKGGDLADSAAPPPDPPKRPNRRPAAAPLKASAAPMTAHGIMTCQDRLQSREFVGGPRSPLGTAVERGGITT